MPRLAVFAVAFGAVAAACARERPEGVTLSKPGRPVSESRGAAPPHEGPAPANDPDGPPPGAPVTDPGPASLDHSWEGKRAVAVLRGEASYYGDSLAGHKTANGERYDPRAFTAAHRSLPFGTVVRVVRVDTRASVVVRITDRGPYGSARRILDLSRAAAERLGMIRRGVADVRAEILAYGARGRRRKR
ncbi:MAG TPA: septal ring lytic transglycosylase RlpA family protein [Polyangiaceae bacterium]|nr:septal ring lytic transglycosylase RlpA family protein [Polyangiaceae bacterium]